MYCIDISNFKDFCVKYDGGEIPMKRISFSNGIDDELCYLFTDNDGDLNPVHIHVIRKIMWCVKNGVGMSEYVRISFTVNGFAGALSLNIQQSEDHLHVDFDVCASGEAEYEL